MNTWAFEIFHYTEFDFHWYGAFALFIIPCSSSWQIELNNTTHVFHLYNLFGLQINNFLFWCLTSMTLVQFLVFVIKNLLWGGFESRCCRIWECVSAGVNNWNEKQKQHCKKKTLVPIKQLLNISLIFIMPFLNVSVFSSQVFLSFPPLLICLPVFTPLHVLSLFPLILMVPQSLIYFPVKTGKQHLDVNCQ